MSRFETATATEGTAPSHSPPDVMFAPGIGMARKLGWFSLALGAAELLAPRMISRATGVRNESLIAAYGLREIVCGIGILTTARPAGWMWARVAGDALDLATLGAACTNGTCQERQAAMTAATAVAGVTMADLVTASGLTAAARLEG
ncbi:hypothetical protein SH661x_003414 [Planctomicrobium sp. SH661]|uniref:hypothetical protein n=1 Tax=Planctomicrobium sp. SH661 TaxID=3448124 RepID=UPI003F5B68C3